MTIISGYTVLPPVSDGCFQRFARAVIFRLSIQDCTYQSLTLGQFFRRLEGMQFFDAVEPKGARVVGKMPLVWGAADCGGSNSLFQTRGWSI